MDGKGDRIRLERWLPGGKLQNGAQGSECATGLPGYGRAYVATDMGA